MTRAFMALFAACLCVPLTAYAQDGQFRDQGGISSPLLSRCAGKYGAEVREADNAFPLLTLMGVPWMKIERTDRTVDGQHIAFVVTGIGTRNRRRGEVVGLRFTCLIDDKGVQIAPLHYPHLSHTEIFHSVEDFYRRFYFRIPKIAAIVGEMIRSPQMMKRRLREGVEFFAFLRAHKEPAH